MRKIMALVCVSAGLATGCTTSNITNLTPSRQVRKANGFYPVEMQWRSTQRSIKEESIKPMVVIGTEFYPMRKTQIVGNRWETVIPVAATNDLVYYTFKVDFDYYDIPIVRPDSRKSQTFQLKLTDR